MTVSVRDCCRNAGEGREAGRELSHAKSHCSSSSEELSRSAFLQASEQFPELVLVIARNLASVYSSRSNPFSFECVSTIKLDEMNGKRRARQMPEMLALSRTVRVELE